MEDMMPPEKSLFERAIAEDPDEDLDTTPDAKETEEKRFYAYISDEAVRRWDCPEFKESLEKRNDACLAEFKRIVSNKITDEKVIEALFRRLWDRMDEKEEYRLLYWKLINYVESFDPFGMTAFYRYIYEKTYEE